MQNEGIANKKETMTPEEICTGLEPEFARFLTYVRSVPLGSKPNYNYLLRLLDTAWRRGGSGNVWDWTRYRYGELLSETDPSGSQDGESDGSRTRSWTRN